MPWMASRTCRTHTPFAVLRWPSLCSMGPCALAEPVPVGSTLLDCGAPSREPSVLRDLHAVLVFVGSVPDICARGIGRHDRCPPCFDPAANGLKRFSQVNIDREHRLNLADSGWTLVLVEATAFARTLSPGATPLALGILNGTARPCLMHNIRSLSLLQHILAPPIRTGPCRALPYQHWDFALLHTRIRPRLRPSCCSEHQD